METIVDYDFGVLANKCLFNLIRLLRPKQLSRKAELKLYHQLILTGSKSWNPAYADVKLPSAVYNNGEPGTTKNYTSYISRYC